MHIFKDTHYDFLRWRWHAIILLWLGIMAGVGEVATTGLPMGVEVAGGTVVITQFDQLVTVQQVRGGLDKSFPGGGGNLSINSYGDPSLRQIMVRVPVLGAESGAS